MLIVIPGPLAGCGLSFSVLMPFVGIDDEFPILDLISQDNSEMTCFYHQE